jgi:hypothetical protein
MVAAASPAVAAADVCSLVLVLMLQGCGRGRRIQGTMWQVNQ